jgi:GT2 family glycosyltransferase
MSTYQASDLAVVIPTRQRWETLERCLDRLAAQTVGGFEIVVVADGRDQYPDLGRHIEQVQLLDQDHAGPGVARNLGIAHTDRALILLMGDDMMAATDLVERHLDAHNRNRQVNDAVVGLVHWDKNSSRGAMQQWLEWSGTQFDYAAMGTEPTEAGWSRFYSSNLSLKRDFFEQVGGFDPEFSFLYEDTELGWRLGQAGMRLWFEPEAVTYHDHRYDWPSLRRRFETAAAAERRMAEKHPWFEPWFRGQAIEALTTRPASPVWAELSHRLPEGDLRRRARAETNRWYHRQLAPFFLNAWASAQDWEELAAYLGDDFDIERLYHHDETIQRELADAPDEATFYRTSQAYLYDLTAFAGWDTKIPYRLDVARYSPPGSRLLDYGCGIGTDGLRLGELGYDVDFADFDNPSTRYLRWRLERRGIDAGVYDLDADDVEPGYHLAYAFDVIEHVPDPFAFLAELESVAGLVAVNFLEEPDHDGGPDQPGHGRPGHQQPGHDPHAGLHHDLPVPALLDHAENAGLLRYRLYHGRSHLVIYRSPGGGSPGGAERVRSRLRRRLGPVLSGPRPWSLPGSPGGAAWR